MDSSDAITAQLNFCPGEEWVGTSKTGRQLK